MPVAKKGGSLKQEIALAKKRDEEVRQVFCKYDVDNTDSIDMDELTALLDDLGILATLKTSPVDFACKMFSEFDENDDGILSFEEFKGVYNAAKDDAAGKARAPKKYGTESGLDSETQQARRKLAEEKARAKAEEAEKRRKENAELKAKVALQRFQRLLNNREFMVHEANLQRNDADSFGLLKPAINRAQVLGNLVEAEHYHFIDQMLLGTRAL